MLTTASAVSAQEDPELTLSGSHELTVDNRVQSAKAPSSALAQTDPELLNLSESTPTQVIVKLDYDAAASYAGTVSGLDATSPSVTGVPLTGESTAEQAYDDYAAEQEAAFVAELERRVPQADVGQSLRVVYGGIAATVPANAVEDVLAIPGVVAVQKDAANEPLTDSSPEFLGAPTVYDDLGTTANAGEGIIYGNLDTGVWPEHASFEDLGNLPPPPGPARECDFGDNPLTPEDDPFVCQNKLIGGHTFLDEYLSDPGRAAAEPFHNARDSDGHGTHTASTTAGNMLDEAPVFGVDQGPLHGLAPGAWVMEYKVCGIQGCFSSDTSAAVGQAILDGVDVINYSISGGTNPFTDPTELAFLDAYAAGVFVAASAGNSGPTAGTANHLSPWVTTVAASTQTREFATTLTLNADNGDSFSVDGASITAGAGPLPVVLAQNVPGYSDPLCGELPPSASTFDGIIVACQRGVQARVWKGFVVSEGGGEGMVLYNPAQADIETDNHWVPTIHVADGTDFVAFMNGHTGVTGSFPAGEKRDGAGDVMAAFSSRGPAGLFLKPDVTAPGVQVLAGASPFPATPDPDAGGGPPGELFQAIAGTSMSSPHTAGAGILLQSVHPDWSPGQVKSALMTTAWQDVVKEDLTTPADPFDYGSGRIDLSVAGDAAITFADDADAFFALGNDPVNAVHLNIPSINGQVSGQLTTTRVATNTLDKQVRYDVTTTAPGGASISVSPSSFRIPAHGTRELTVTIETSETSGTFIGEIVLTPTQNATVPLHLPVVYEAGQGDVSLTQTCADETVERRDTTTCDVEAVNNGFGEATVDLTTTVSRNLRVASVDGADQITPRSVHQGPVTLAGAQPGIPSVDPGASPAGYLPLDAFGVTPIAVGDEEIVNFSGPPFVYNGETFTTFGVDSNGYVVVGGGSSEDNECCNLPDGPDPARPNNMLAPFWTDLDGTGAPGFFVATLTDGVNTWIVVEFRLNVFGTTSLRVLQTWIGINGTQDISYAYDPANLPGDPFGQPFLVGAENIAGEGDMEAVLPTGDLRVTSTDPIPGGSTGYQVEVLGATVGDGTVRTVMEASTVSGLTVVTTPIEVVPR
ncbi:MAG: S8 family serine peptidase [Jiangellaceae bacterium]